MNDNDNPFGAPENDVGLGSSDSLSGNARLQSLSFKELKKLWNNSQTISTLGVLWALGAVLIVILITLGGGVFVKYVKGNRDVLLILSVFFGFEAVLLIVGVIASRLRHMWCHIYGIILCGLGCLSVLFSPNVIGIVGLAINLIGLIAYAKSVILFGPNRITHAELKQEYKTRKRNKDYR